MKWQKDKKKNVIITFFHCWLLCRYRHWYWKHFYKRIGSKRNKFLEKKKEEKKKATRGEQENSTFNFNQYWISHALSFRSYVANKQERKMVKFYFCIWLCVTLKITIVLYCTKCACEAWTTYFTIFFLQVLNVICVFFYHFILKLRNEWLKENWKRDSRLWVNK